VSPGNCISVCALVRVPPAQRWAPQISYFLLVSFEKTPPQTHTGNKRRSTTHKEKPQDCPASSVLAALAQCWSSTRLARLVIGVWGVCGRGGEGLIEVDKCEQVCRETAV
jgi:hypothetical protein